MRTPSRVLSFVCALVSTACFVRPGFAQDQTCESVFAEGVTLLGGNNISTLVTNRGSVSSPGERLSDLVWRSLGYGYEFGPFAAAEVAISGNTVHIVSDGLRSHGGEPDVDWSWQQVACTDTLESNSKSLALRFRMNDASNDEFAYYPSRSEPSRRGLGLDVNASMAQFTDPAREDALYLTYTFTNRGTSPLEKVIFGMWGDPHVGGYADFHDDSAAFDEELGLLAVWDPDGRASDGVTQPGVLGFLFLEGPVGLTGFNASPFGSVTIANDAAVWQDAQPGFASPAFSAGDNVYLFASGPVTLEPGATAELASVLFFAESLGKLREKAEELKRLHGLTKSDGPGDMSPHPIPPEPAPPVEEPPVPDVEQAPPVDEPPTPDPSEMAAGPDCALCSGDPGTAGLGSGDGPCNCPRFLREGLDSLLATITNVGDTVRALIAATELTVAEEFVRDAGASAVSTLRDQTGVFVAEVAQNEHHISARDFNTPLDPKPHLLLDRRRTTIPGLGANIYGLLPITAIDLDHADVVRSPSSNEFGSEADEGAILFGTKDPFDYTGTTVSLDLGESATREASLRHAWKMGPTFAAKLVGSYSEADDEVIGGARVGLTGSPEEADTFRKAFIRGTASYRPCDCMSFTLNADFTTLDQNLFGAGRPLVLDGFRSTSAQLLFDSPRLFGQVYYQGADPGESIVFGTEVPLSDKSNLFGTELRYNVGTVRGVQDIVFGFDYTNSDISAIPSDVGFSKTAQTFGADQTANETAFFFDSRVPLSRTLSTHLAARLDIEDLTDQTHVSPRVGLSYHPSEQHRLFFAVNRSFSVNANVAFYQDAQIAGDATFFRGADQLKDIPETISTLFELGYRGTSADWGSVGLNLFYVRKENQVSPPSPVEGSVTVRLDPPGPAGDPGGATPSSALGFGDLTYAGVDLFARITPDPRSRVTGSLSWLNRTFFESDDITNGPPGYVAAMNRPGFLVKTRFERQFTEDLFVAAALRYTDSYRVHTGFVSGKVNAAFLVDLQVGIDLRKTGVPGARLYVTGRNLFDAEHRVYPGAPTMGRRIAARLIMGS